MADSAAKRMREAKKRRQQEMKNERKKLRASGQLGRDPSGLFAPGEMAREVVDASPPPPPPPPETPPEAPQP
jgi:hypothetical protein